MELGGIMGKGNNRQHKNNTASINKTKVKKGSSLVTPVTTNNALSSAQIQVSNTAQIPSKKYIAYDEKNKLFFTQRGALITNQS